MISVAATKQYVIKMFRKKFLTSTSGGVQQQLQSQDVSILVVNKGTSVNVKWFTPHHSEKAKVQKNS
jgi:hypothetical protein